MKNMSFRQSLASAAVAVALGLSTGSADAVVYSSFFDPPDFEGIATFDVDQACLDAGPGFVDPYTLSGCDVTWLTATVTLKEPTFTPRTFDYHPDFLPSSSVVNNIFVQGGELRGVNSDVIGPVVISGDPNPNFNGPWWIQYSFTDTSSFLASLVTPSDGAFGFGIVRLFTGECRTEPEPICTRNPTPVEIAQVENFTRVSQVPEPGILGLILGALGGAWFARRRRKFAT